MARTDFQAAAWPETREHLRALIRRIESRPPARREPASRPPRIPPLDSVFPAAARRETPSGSCLVIEEWYPFHHRVGTQPLGDLDHVTPDELTLLTPDEEFEDVCVDDLLFLDIETTGLGGAGALAFLVAAGRVERRHGDHGFALRQYLALSPPEEAGVMEALIADSGLRDRDPVLVTYNGRVFDAPLLDERATMHRMRAGFEGLRHVDLLAPVRTGLRGVLASCRLASVECEWLGLTRPPGEAEGYEVPAYYFRFLRTGDPRLLAPLVEHNAQDVVSLGALLGRFAAALRGAAPLTPLDALALGRLHAARGMHDAAIAHLREAVGALPTGGVRDDAMRRLALLHRRAGRRDLAEPLWRELAAAGRVSQVEALVEIAKHLEHDRRDHAAALKLIDDALAVVDAVANLDVRATLRRGELLRRRARLLRRVARTADR